MSNPDSEPQSKTPGDWFTFPVSHFSLDSPVLFKTAVDAVITTLGSQVKLLGLGEALHGGEDILILRNRLFEYLVENHGYTAIALESSFTRGNRINDFITRDGPESYDLVQKTGFSHEFGRLNANRELVAWMRHYNEDPAHPVKLRFYGFDSPTEMMFTESPRELLEIALDYLLSVDPARGREFRDRVVLLLGSDADWENPEAMMDPASSVGLSADATALRAETEELITELHIRRPEFVKKSGQHQYLQAMHGAVMARQLLTYHAGVARRSDNRISRLLGIRDAMMADNLSYVVSCEQDRGKVLAFAHNSHLKCGSTEWELAGRVHTWWAAGAHMKERLGPGYAVIGSGVGISEDNGIREPESGTLEAVLTATPGPVRFVPTRQARDDLMATDAIIPVRSASSKNSTYFPLTSQSLTDYDRLVLFDTITYARGGPELPS